MIEASPGNAEYFYEPSLVCDSPWTQAPFLNPVVLWEVPPEQSAAMVSAVSCLPSQLTKRHSARDTKEPAALKGLRRGDNSLRFVKARCPTLLKM